MMHLLNSFRRFLYLSFLSFSHTFPTDTVCTRTQNSQPRTHFAFVFCVCHWPSQCCCVDPSLSLRLFLSLTLAKTTITLTSATTERKNTRFNRVPEIRALLLLSPPPPPPPSSSSSPLPSLPLCKYVIFCVPICFSHFDCRYIELFIAFSLIVLHRTDAAVDYTICDCACVVAKVYAVAAKPLNIIHSVRCRDFTRLILRRTYEYEMVRPLQQRNSNFIQEISITRSRSD